MTLSAGMRLLQLVVTILGTSKDVTTPHLIALHQGLAEALEEDLKSMLSEELSGMLSVEQLEALVEHARRKTSAEEKK